MRFFQSLIKKISRRFSRWWGLLTVLLGGFVLGLLGFYLFEVSDFLKVDQVEILGAKSFVNKSDLAEVVKTKALGKNIFFLNKEEIRQCLQENFQGARSIYVQKILPRELKISIDERVPMAVVMTPKLEESYLVDEEGYVLGIVEEKSTNLPNVQYEGNIKVGYFLDQKLISVYFEVLKALDEEEILASSVSVTPRYLRFFVNNLTEVFIGSDKDVSSAVKALRALITQLKAEGRNPKKIDLRYDKVSVSYE